MRIVLAEPEKGGLAAMHPAETNFFYFVADPANPGHHHFAVTAAEHVRNVGAYRRATKR